MYLVTALHNPFISRKETPLQTQLNQNWLAFIAGEQDDVLARVKLQGSKSEVLSLRNDRGFIKVVCSVPNGSVFLGCEVPIGILRQDEYLASASLSTKNQKLWRILRWRFAFEIAVFNDNAVQRQTAALPQLTARHLGVGITSTGRFYLRTRYGRICVRRDVSEGEVWLSLEGLPKDHPIVSVRRGQPVLVKITKEGFAAYQDQSPEQAFCNLLQEQLLLVTATV